MRKNLLKHIFFFIFATLILIPENCISKTITETSYLHLTVENGLPNNRVYNALEDSQGFMWFSTENGLVRYDGYDFKIYRNDPNNPNSLSGNSIWQTNELPDGRLWVSAWGDGATIFDLETETFQRLRHDPDDPKSIGNNIVHNAVTDPDGNIWISTGGGGLNILDIKTNTFQRIIHDPDDPESIPTNILGLIHKARDERYFWIGTWANGFFKFDTKTRKAIHLKNADTHPDTSGRGTSFWFYEDENQVLWVGTRVGVNRYDLKTQKFIKDGKYPELDGMPITGITPMGDGNLWVTSSTKGVFIVDLKLERIIHFSGKISETNTASSDLVRQVFKSSNDQIWISTYDGVEQYIPNHKRFDFFEKPRNAKGLSTGGVTAFETDLGGNIWVGIDKVGIQILDIYTGKTKMLTHDPDDPNSISSNQITSLALDQEGDIWIGTRNGLNKYEHKDGKITRFFNDPDDPKSIAGNTIYKIVVHGDNTLWIGFQGGGLQNFDPEKGEIHHYDNVDKPSDSQLTSPYVRSIFIDGDDILWVGTDSGFNKIDTVTQKITNYVHNPKRPASIGSGAIQDILIDRKDRMWLGTDAGLSLMINGTDEFKTLTRNHGLPGDSVMSITEDNDGFLWLGTNNGIAKFSPDTEEFIPFAQDDGLQGKLFNTGAAMTTVFGKIYFGGTKGFNRGDPKRITLDTRSPNVVLTDFQIFNKSQIPGSDGPLKKSISMAKQIILDSSHSVFGFRFAALNFFAPNKIKYAYILEGIDRDWVHVDVNQRIATYSNLDPGNYNFRVRTTNADGIWSKKEASIKLTILPDWWETSWFRIGLLLLIGGIIITYFRWRTAFYRQQEKELKKLVKQRTAEVVQEKKLVQIAARARSIFLNNSGQGFLSFGKDLVVESEYSAECEKIFETCPAGLSVTELVYNDSIQNEKKANLNNNLTLIFSEKDEFRQKIYLSLLPDEFKLKKKFVKAEYNIVSNEKIMMILTNITKNKELENKITKERNYLKFVVSTVRETRDFFEILEDYKTFCDETSALLSEENKAVDIFADIYRNIHTFKGLFGQQDFIYIPEYLHKMETLLSGINNPDSIEVKETIQQIAKDMDYAKTLEKDLAIIQDTIGKEFMEQRGKITISTEHIKLLEDKARKLMKMELNHVDDDAKELFNSIRELRYVNIKKILNSHSAGALDLAKRLNKKIKPFYAQGDDIKLDPKTYSSFTKSLVHVFRNAIDHGIETVEQRVKAGKKEEALLTCFVTCENENRMVICITDDGKGISIENLRDVSIKKGLFTRDEANKKTDKQILDLIFLQDFTTQRNITNISGRGVGLSAVYDELIKLDGIVTIETEQGKGTQFKFSIPL